MSAQNIARTNMIEGQLRPNRINDEALIAAFQSVKRENFVPTSEAGFAYADRPLALADGRELMSPLCLAHLLNALHLTQADNLLILAGNTGYSAAIARHLAGTVTVVEDHKDMAAAAAKIPGITVIKANPANWQPKQPYTVVLLDAAVASLPAHAHTWLTEGGRLAAIVVNPLTGLPTQTTYIRHGNTLFATHLAETQGTPHPAFTEAPGFVF